MKKTVGTRTTGPILAVLGSDSDESGCESDGAVVASDGES